MDAHATVIEAALKGYDRWRASRIRRLEDVSDTVNRRTNEALTVAQTNVVGPMEEYFEKWCGQLLEMKFEVRPC